MFDNWDATRTLSCDRLETVAIRVPFWIVTADFVVLITRVTITELGVTTAIATVALILLYDARLSYPLRQCNTGISPLYDYFQDYKG